jgi:hypothetical protein
MVQFVRKLADGRFLFQREGTYFALTIEDMKVLQPIFNQIINETQNVE